MDDGPASYIADISCDLLSIQTDNWDSQYSGTMASYSRSGNRGCRSISKPSADVLFPFNAQLLQTEQELHQVENARLAMETSQLNIENERMAMEKQRLAFELRRSDIIVDTDALVEPKQSLAEGSRRTIYVDEDGNTLQDI